MTILAKSIKGAEFAYSAASAHKVPKTSARKICNALNKVGYKLNAGECWFVHEVSGWENAGIYAEGQRFAIRNGRLIEKIGGC